MSTDERYATALRERFHAAAPVIHAEPEPIMARGKRRRRLARAGGALGALALVAAAFGAAALLSRATLPPVTPPPEPASDVSLWLSAEQVPPGDVELAAVLVNHTGVDVTFGVLATVDRWDGAAWVPRAQLAMCLDEWTCTADLLPSDAAVDLPVIGLSPTTDQPGPVERFTTDGLDPGWYRISQTANEGVVARGMVEVVEGATPPAPLWPLDRPAISVQPAVVPTTGGTVVLTPLVPTREDGTQTTEDIAAAVEGLSEVAAIERWDGATWAVVDDAPLGVGDTFIPGTQVLLEVPPLDAGAYRVVRSGPNGDQTGNFWVAVPEAPRPQDVVILDQYDGLPPEIYGNLPGDGIGHGAIVELDARAITVYTTGSSTCPLPPTGIDVQDDVVIVYLGEAVVEPDRECTADISYRTYLVAFPDGFAPTEVPGFELRSRSTGALIPAEAAPPDVGPPCYGLDITVCVLNVWLDDLIVASGYEPGGGDHDFLAGSDAIGFGEGSAVMLKIEPLDPAAAQTPERTTSVGALTVDHGTYDDGTSWAAFVCGGFQFAVWGLDPPGTSVAEVAERVAAQVGTCPESTDPLVAWYGL